MKLKEDDRIVVCGKCLQASCWLGEFMCDESKYAGTKTITVKELRKLNLENEEYWERTIERNDIPLKN